jgi:hypothetical protein
VPSRSPSPAGCSPHKGPIGLIDGVRFFVIRRVLGRSLKPGMRRRVGPFHGIATSAILEDRVAPVGDELRDPSPQQNRAPVILAGCRGNDRRARQVGAGGPEEARHGGGHRRFFKALTGRIPPQREIDALRKRMARDAAKNAKEPPRRNDLAAGQAEHKRGNGHRGVNRASRVGWQSVSVGSRLTVGDPANTESNRRRGEGGHGIDPVLRRLMGARHGK